MSNSEWRRKMMITEISL